LENVVRNSLRFFFPDDREVLTGNVSMFGFQHHLDAELQVEGGESTIWQIPDEFFNGGGAFLISLQPQIYPGIQFQVDGTSFRIAQSLHPGSTPAELNPQVAALMTSALEMISQ